MSTFYGGPQLALVTSISRTTTGTSSYTVPSGYWAEVSFITIDSGGTFPNYSTGSINGTVVASGNNTKEFGMVSSGGVISITSSAIAGDAYGYAGIKVYKNP